MEIVSRVHRTLCPGAPAIGSAVFRAYRQGQAEPNRHQNITAVSDAWRPNSGEWALDLSNPTPVGDDNAFVVLRGWLQIPPSTGVVFLVILIGQFGGANFAASAGSVDKPVVADIDSDMGYPPVTSGGEKFQIALLNLVALDRCTDLPL